MALVQLVKDEMASDDGWIVYREIPMPRFTAAAKRAAMALVLAMENDIPLLPEEIRRLRAEMVLTDDHTSMTDAELTAIEAQCGVATPPDVAG